MKKLPAPIFITIAGILTLTAAQPVLAEDTEVLSVQTENAADQNQENDLSNADVISCGAPNWRNGIIEDQTFQTQLSEYTGDVWFASYAPADGEKDGRQMAAGGRPTCNRRAANGSGQGWPTGQGMPFMESGSLFGAYAVSLAPRASPGTALANAYRNGIHERRFFIAAIPEHGRTANGTDGRKKPDGTAGRHDTGTSGKPPG